MRFLLILLSTLLFTNKAIANLNIVTTTSDLAYFAEKIGGDYVTVKSLARGDQDAHFLEPKPSYIIATNKADLFIHNGLDLEIGWVPVLINQARNPKIQNNQPGNLDASNGVSVIEKPDGIIDRSMGDVHPQGNPHYLLNPENVLIVCSHIVKVLSQLDQDHAAVFQSNFDSYATHLKEKIKKWKTLGQTLNGKQIITYHKTFNYLTNWLNIKVAGYLEPKSGLPPTANHIMELTNTIKTQNIKVIATEIYHEPKPGRELALKTGIKALEWPTSVGGTAEVNTYEQLIDFLIIQLKDHL